MKSQLTQNPFKKLQRKAAIWRPHVIVSFWIVIVCLFGILPFITQVLFKMFFRVKNDCFFPTCSSGNEMSYDCMKDFFQNNLGWIFLTVSLTGSLFVDIAIDVCIKGGKIIKNRRFRFYVSTSFCIFCFTLSVGTGILNPKLIESVIKENYFNSSLFHVIQAVVFLLALISTYISKMNFSLI